MCINSCTLKMTNRWFSAKFLHLHILSIMHFCTYSYRSRRALCIMVLILKIDFNWLKFYLIFKIVAHTLSDSTICKMRTSMLILAKSFVPGRNNNLRSIAHILSLQQIFVSTKCKQVYTELSRQTVL